MSLESLLNLIDNPEDRTALEGLTAKHTKLAETLTRAQEYEAWAAQAWDTEHAMPKNEYRQKQQILELNRLLAEQAAQGASGMELSELNGFLDEQIKAGRLVSKETLEAKDAEWAAKLAAANDPAKRKTEIEAEIKAREAEYSKYFGELVNAQAKFAVEIPYLNQKHQNEFGELFDPNEFLTKATEAKATDLREYYKNFTAEKSAAKAKADMERQIAEAELRGAKKALQEQALGSQGVNQNPSSDGGPEMGHFQAKLLKMPMQGEGKSPVPEGAELGKGQIAAAMARAGDKAEIEARTA